ncbi:uncharacterized protein UV8b_03431 [Ustilaginoidea virens]|uniref:AB hydrolase-1 domain-containing protein n=1 Tax=Ustilaginoidea virens TaxID=1159556 RepID=A0A8E5HPC5_USTVR|nr:uncharacterized protein UV8b_03431 [Ustilaginoidea virens]QUC19190.1 hypothetical protein UV8b_03431 [Ustilaginoidea virens]
MKLALALCLASAAVASAMSCEDMTVPVSISARNGVFNLPPPASEIDVTNLFLGLSRPGNNQTADLLQGYETVSGSYRLAATYCQPDDGPGHTLQILTHGVGFDRSYWHFPFNDYNYSYVAEAVAAGYSTLSWDRLGIGRSSHGGPVNEIQLFLEVAALEALTRLARNGSLWDEPRRFNRTVHLGHSFGSAMTYSLSAMRPDVTDAIVLTGFSQVPQFMPYFALGGHFSPVKNIDLLARHYAEGYIAPKDSIGVHINFFGPGDFDPEILDAATKTGQPAAVGELLTVGSTPATSNFAGPVMIITGDGDVPFCGGNCMNTAAIHGSSPNLIDYSRKSFKSASVFKATIVPGAGHNLNYAYSAHQTYRSILDFIDANTRR